MIIANEKLAASKIDVYTSAKTNAINVKTMPISNVTLKISR